MAEILDIAQLGNPILRQLAQSVTNVTDPQWQEFIDSLMATAKATNGVGIAAPQVSQPYRLLIVASRPSPRYPDAPIMEPTAMINPKILTYSEEKVKGWEGCLSVPGWRGFVPRYQAISVEYLDRYGNLKRQELKDFVARIFQHEFDHLEGIVFLDRLESSQDLISEQDYQELINH
jgi:peptide deformylase